MNTERNYSASPKADQIAPTFVQYKAKNVSCPKGATVATGVNDHFLTQ